MRGNGQWNHRSIWCHSQVFQYGASWWFQRSHMEGLEIAESTFLDERCPKGGYQGRGTQSKHLAHMHTLALRVFASDENWQRSLCNDCSRTCDPLLLWQPSSQTSNSRPWQRAKRSFWITEQVLPWSKSRLWGQGAGTNQNKNVASADGQRRICQESMISAKNMFYGEIQKATGTSWPACIINMCIRYLMIEWFQSADL